MNLIKFQSQIILYNHELKLIIFVFEENNSMAMDGEVSVFYIIYYHLENMWCRLYLLLMFSFWFVLFVVFHNIVLSLICFFLLLIRVTVILWNSPLRHIFSLTRNILYHWMFITMIGHNESRSNVELIWSQSRIYVLIVVIVFWCQLWSLPLSLSLSLSLSFSFRILSFFLFRQINNWLHGHHIHKASGVDAMASKTISVFGYDVIYQTSTTCYESHGFS